MPQKGKLNAEEKVEIVRRYQQGEMSLVQAARYAGVGTTTIYRWSARYEAEGAAGFLPYQQNRVYPPELKLKAVREYLSGAGSPEEISKKYKLRNDRQLHNWIKVYNAHGTFNSAKFSGGGSYMKQRRETTLKERIQIVRDCIAVGKNYGEMALKYQVSYQQVFKWYEGIEVHKLYLSAILDLCDRRIVSYVLSESNDNPLVYKTFDKAVKANSDAHPHLDLVFRCILYSTYRFEDSCPKDRLISV